MPGLTDLNRILQLRKNSENTLIYEDTEVSVNSNCPKSVRNCWGQDFDAAMSISKRRLFLHLRKQATLHCSWLLFLRLSVFTASQVVLVVKNMGFNPWVWKVPLRRKWLSTPVFLPGESHGQESLAGYSPRGCTESDTTERLNSNFPWPHSTSPSVHDPTGNHCLLFLASLPRGGSSINKCIPSMDILTPFCVPTTPHAFWSFLLWYLRLPLRAHFTSVPSNQLLSSLKGCIDSIFMCLLLFRYCFFKEIDLFFPIFLSFL